MGNEKLFGQANDGTQYSVDSPAVAAYKAKYQDVNDDAAIASVVGMHDAIIEGSDIANAEEVADVIALIKENIPADTTDIPCETDGDQSTGVLGSPEPVAGSDEFDADQPAEPVSEDEAPKEEPAE
jgi:hypothetical protein